jgi:urease accessory protein
MMPAPLPPASTVSKQMLHSTSEACASEDSAGKSSIAEQAIQHRVQSLLHLVFARKRSQTRLHLAAQEPPQRVVRPFGQQDGAAAVHLHNLSGGVLGGDQLRLDVEVMPQAHAQITSTGATRVYRHRPGYEDAQQQSNLVVHPGGLLEMLPDALIPFAGARYRQQTRIALAEDAGLFYWEIIAPGRVAAGEQFAYERLGVELEISACDQPILLEHFVLEPAQRPLSSLARLGSYHYVGAFYLCRAGVEPDKWLALEQELDVLARSLNQADMGLWGVSTLPAHGLVVRVVAMHQRIIANALLRFWSKAKSFLYQMPAIAPRKLY